MYFQGKTQKSPPPPTGYDAPSTMTSEDECLLISKIWALLFSCPDPQAHVNVSSKIYVYVGSLNIRDTLFIPTYVYMDSTNVIRVIYYHTYTWILQIYDTWVQS